MVEVEERDWIDKWAGSLLEAGCAASTQRRYRSVAQTFVAWFEQQNHETFAPARLTPLTSTTMYSSFVRQVQQVE